MEIIDKLLENGDFDELLRVYELYKYELLDIIYNAMFERDENNQIIAISEEEKAILKSIYTQNATMHNFNAEKVMFISDTHLENENTERLDYFWYILDFCQKHQIRYLIHGGDVADGTDYEKKIPIFFSDAKSSDASKQINNILAKYPKVKDIKQFILGGNHDWWYLELNNKFDILRKLADCKDISPLGFHQAYITICDVPISLEHSSEHIITKNYIPHDLSIQGHSHIWMPNKDKLYIPTLSNFLYHFDKIDGQAGFVIMQPIQTTDGVILHFDRYTFIETNNFLNASKTAEKAYTLTRKKGM